jgi:hypothetical protein
MSDVAPAPAPFPAPPAARRAPGIGTDGTYTRLGQVLAFIFALYSMFAFVPMVFLGAILYDRSEAHFAQNPKRARTMVIWSWLSITVLSTLCGAIVLTVVMLSRG